MFKIKDDVDLKKLEKFGFKLGSKWIKKYENERYSFDSKDIGCYYFDNGLISIDTEGKEARKIIFEIYKADSILDVMYDLIQAGLVEKVK